MTRFEALTAVQKERTGTEGKVSGQRRYSTGHIIEDRGRARLNEDYCFW